MKSFKDISEQHAEEGRFKPVKPQNVSNKSQASPRDSSDSASVKLKEHDEICKFCQHDPCICDDSHGFVSEARMSAAVKLQRAFEREQLKTKSRVATGKEQDDAWERTKKHLEKPENMSVLKRLKNEEAQLDEAGNKTLEPHIGMGDSRTPRELKTDMSKASTDFVKSTAAKKPGMFHSKVAHMQNKLAKSELRKRVDEGYNDYHNNRTGFAKRPREDDEYHVPDDNRQTHTVKMKLSKDGGEVQHKQINVTTAHGAEHAKKFAHETAKKQGWTVHEEVEHIEEAMSPAKQGIVAAGGGTPADKGIHAAAQEKPPFDGPYTKTRSATPGKHGSGYSTARHLARQAMSKIAKTKLKEEEEFSRKAQIVKNAKKGKKSDDTFQPEPELGSTVVKADN